MASRLNQKREVRTLARDLGLKVGAEPVRAIVEYCRRRVQAYVEEYRCESLTDLLEIVGAKIGVVFVEVHDDGDIVRLAREHVAKGEHSFARIDEELHGDVYGITIRRTACKSWEPPYVAIIDCRGEKKPRSYFTKWHEIAHLLTLPPQLKLKFYRSDLAAAPKDPLESLMDLIAGNIGFFSELVAAHASGSLSFEKIQKLRENLCPEASFTSSLIGLVSSWPTPCILVEAGLGLKKQERETLLQGRFAFRSAPSPALRARNVTINEAARKRGLRIHKNMRVPENSVIYRVFEGEADQLEDVENLASWESSGGSQLPGCSVVVSARRYATKVYALVAPSKSGKRKTGVIAN